MFLIKAMVITVMLEKPMEHPEAAIKSISIKGLRSFMNEVLIKLAIPNGKPGSGLTIIVGPNNAGKSTIIEAFFALSRSFPPGISEGMRNKMAEDRVLIQATNYDNDTIELRTVNVGGGLTEWKDNLSPFTSDVFVLPSRRTFEPFFNQSENRFAKDRDVYNQSRELPVVRGQKSNSFPQRIFGIQEKKEEFNHLLAQLLDVIPEWRIERSDEGKYFMRFNNGDTSHNSDGLGEGILSLFFIVDSLYDSKEGDTIVIDEPELSLHPSLQRKLAKLFLRYTKDRQIILATHSPYFIDWKSIINGGKIVRIVKENNVTEAHELSPESVEGIKNQLRDLNNPHVLGLNACEAFFLDDRIILVEGPQDVIFYNKIKEELNIELDCDFFGWGAGGADKMKFIAGMLHDLGFKKVVGILDKNKKDEKENLRKNLKRSFPHYEFFVIPTEDVRDKEEDKRSFPKVDGLVKKEGNEWIFKPEYREDVLKIFREIHLQFCPKT